MKMNELLEGRHPHDQYYRAKPKSQFKWKPRPKKTLWYTKDMFDNWSADIRTRFSDATAYYDEENEEVVASSADMKKSYGRWRKNDKEGRNGVSYYKPRPLDTVTHGRKRLRLATEGFDMILKELMTETQLRRDDNIKYMVNAILQQANQEPLDRYELDDWYDVFSDENSLGYGNDPETVAKAVAAEVIGERNGRDIADSWDDRNG